MLTLVDVLKRTEGFLRERGVGSPRLDAELLLGAVLGLDRVALYVQFERPMTEEELDALRPLVRRRGAREPMAWILGTKGFHKLDLTVKSNVLVPRPDTELLVEAALARIPADTPCFVADVGCGTGAVGLAIAAERPEVRLYAIDLSEDALACTRENVAALDLGARVAVLKGSLLDPVPRARPIDVVVSNPPYIATAELDTLAPEVRDHEPRLALDGGVDGLDVYRVLVPAAAARARSAVLVEIGASQGPAVKALFEAAGLTDVTVRKDLAGHDRVVEGTARAP